MDMRKLLKILSITFVSILAILLIWEYFHIMSISENEVYIFPKDFKGVVLIAYNQKDGLDDINEDGKLIYRIPMNGILKLKRPLEASISKSWYYFEDAEGNRTEFYYCFPPCHEMDTNPNKVFAFGESSGSSFEGEYTLDRSILLVGTRKETDSLSIIVEKMNAIKMIRNE
jgi:hypothetical protein